MAKRKRRTQHPNRSNPHEVHLQERLNIPGLGPFYPHHDKNWPQVEIPPMMRKQDLLIGLGMDEANMLEQMYKLAPQLRGRAGSITSGYGPGYIRNIAEADKPEYLNNRNYLNILGLTHRTNDKRGNIEINTLGDSFPNTLAHEFTHMNAMRALDRATQRKGYVDPDSYEAPVVVWGGHNRDIGHSFGPELSGKLADRVFLGKKPDDIHLFPTPDQVREEVYQKVKKLFPSYPRPNQTK